MTHSSEIDPRAGFAAVARRAFELHVLHLVQGYGPLQDASYRNMHGGSRGTIFLRAELVNQYPQTRVKVYTYDRARDRELEYSVAIWDSNFANGEPVDVKQMHSPEDIAGEIMIRYWGG
jgi:hypothetical protein